MQAPTATYTYTYDELRHLATAQRADGSTTHASKTFVYDSQGERVLEYDNLSSKSNVTFFDSLILKDVPYVSSTNTYDLSSHDGSGFSNEHFFAGGGLAEVFFDAAGALPELCPTSGSGSCNRQHTFINISDRLGSTAFVIDAGTGEIVERTTHQAYGGLLERRHEV